ncbi:MAG: transposase [Janthinobacterium lividum]
MAMSASPSMIDCAAEMIAWTPLPHTGLKLHGSGEWLFEKHGTKTRWSWRKLHIAVDADTGRIAAASLTTSDVDDASQVGRLLDRVNGPVASFIADGAYD